MGQITTITDDKNNVTRAGYDALGRRISFDSPDAGRSETRYDSPETSPRRSPRTCGQRPRPSNTTTSTPG
nr:hypothetical protein [Streptomyces cinereoruber]